MGVCVGMQMLSEGSEEGKLPGLGWIKGYVRSLRGEVKLHSLPVPHMGWNDLTILRPEHPVLAGIDSGEHAYFVHSYAMRPTDEGDVLATTEYGRPIVAIVGRDNMVGTQFHPEKSQTTGLKFITNFLEWRP